MRIKDGFHFPSVILFASLARHVREQAERIRVFSGALYSFE